MTDTPIRRAPRLQHEMMVQVASGGSTFSGWGTNLSLGGVFVNAQSVLPAGSPVDVLLHLPGQPRCKLSGRVAWSAQPGPGVDEPGMGIEFIEVDEETRQLVGAMVVRLSHDLTGRPGSL